MAKTNFEKLEVDPLSEQIADLISGVVGKWPPFARDTVGKQMLRSIGRFPEDAE